MLLSTTTFHKILVLFQKLMKYFIRLPCIFTRSIHCLTFCSDAIIFSIQLSISTIYSFNQINNSAKNWWYKTSYTAECTYSFLIHDMMALSLCFSGNFHGRIFVFHFVHGIRIHSQCFLCPLKSVCVFLFCALRGDLYLCTIRFGCKFSLNSNTDKALNTKA